MASVRERGGLVNPRGNHAENWIPYDDRCHGGGRGQEQLDSDSLSVEQVGRFGISRPEPVEAAAGRTWLAWLLLKVTRRRERILRTLAGEAPPNTQSAYSIVGWAQFRLTSIAFGRPFR